jgi:hypothetical protein
MINFTNYQRYYDNQNPWNDEFYCHCPHCDELVNSDDMRTDEICERCVTRLEDMKEYDQLEYILGDDYERPY